MRIERIIAGKKLIPSAYRGAQLMRTVLTRNALVAALIPVIAAAGCSEPETGTSADIEPSVEAAEPPQTIETVEAEPEPLEYPDDEFAPAREAIDRFCAGDEACVREQRSEMGYFVTMMAGFDDRNRVVAERCMRSGLVDGGVDWTIATPCMRDTVEGKAIGGAID